MPRPKLYKTEEERKQARSRYNKIAYQSRANTRVIFKKSSKNKKRGTNMLERSRKTAGGGVVSECNHVADAKPARLCRVSKQEAAPTARQTQMEGPMPTKTHTTEDFPYLESIQTRSLPAMLDDLPPSDEEEESEKSMSEDESDNKQSIASMYHTLQLEVNTWTPEKMYRTAALGPFIWGILQETPAYFDAQMSAMIGSGIDITRRLFLFMAGLKAQDTYYAGEAEALYFRVHLAMAGVQIRRRMVKEGFIDICPQVMEWEHPDDSWTSIEEYFGWEERTGIAPGQEDGNGNGTGQRGRQEQN